jgi:hypothetical protein
LNKQKHLKSDEYINDLEEWMEHQYDPGYWTGGNIPPHIKYVKRPSHLILVLLGALIMIFSIYRFFINLNSDISACLLDSVMFFIGGVIAISNFKELWTKGQI